MKRKIVLNSNFFHFVIIFLTVIYVFLKENNQYISSNVLSILLACIIVLLPLKEKIYTLFYFIPFYLYIYIFSFAFYNVISIAIIIHFLLLRKKISIKYIFLTFLILCFEIYTGLFNDSLNIMYIIKWSLCFFVSLSLMNGSTISLNKYKSGFLYVIGVALMGIFTLMQYNSFSVDSIMREELAGALSTLDQNTFSMYCLLGGVIGVCLVFDGDNSNKFFKIACSLLLIICFLAGALMVSKTYFLVLIFYVLMLLFKNIRDAKKFIITFLSITSIVLLIIFLPFTNSLLDSVLSRFGSNNDIYEITTGRTGIIMEYIKALIENPLGLFFGAGLFSYNIFYDIKFISDRGQAMITHNILLEIICAFGIVGFTILLVMYIKIFKKNIKYSSSYWNYIPLIIFIIFAQSISIFREDVTHYIILLCFIMTKSNSIYKVT